MIRTEGDIVLASNMAIDLTKMITTFLRTWREFANGVNGVTVPSQDDFTVLILPLKKEGRVECRIVWSQQHYRTVSCSYEVEDAYGPDDDMYNERLGANNTYGVHNEYYEEQEAYIAQHEETYSLYSQHLLLPKLGMVELIKRQAAKCLADERARNEKAALDAARAAAVARIAAITKELEDLQKAVG